MTRSVKSLLSVPSSFISIFSFILPLQVSSVSSRVGIFTLLYPGPILAAEWSFLISSRVISRIVPSCPMRRFKLLSWNTTGTLSLVSFTSSSIQSAPLSMAFSKAGIVFSSAFIESPLWAVISTFWLHAASKAKTGAACPRQIQAAMRNTTPPLTASFFLFFIFKIINITSWNKFSLEMSPLVAYHST